jgi:eukaryotic-like serine/threonine-protein kinase
MAVEVGQRIGEYEILSLLGAGGMGRVYCVRNVISDRVDAMKILLPDLVAEAELAARFTAEIRTLASFDHPNIAQLRTAFQHENQLVMIMEFVEGVTLEKKAAKAALPVEEVLSYASQVLAALSYAHSRGVIHRDLKPANMMVTGHGVIKLMDFGIAKTSSELQLTRPGTTMGSVYYMSPEQVSGGTVDARSDIYSLGVTLYELLTGRRPFQADTAFSVLHAQINTPPQPPIELNKSLPAALNNIILTALAKNPAQRFQTAEAFRNALRSLSSGNLAAAAVAPEIASTPTITPAGVGFADPPFEPVSIGSTPAPVQKSYRGLWIGMGAAAALAAMIAAATILPHFLSTHATSGGSTQTPINSQASLPSSQTQPQPVVLPPPTVDPGVQAPPGQVNEPNTTSTGSQPKTPQDRKPAEKSRTVSGGGSSQVVTPPPQPPPQAQPQQATGASAAELEEASDRLTQVSARASAAKESIDQIRRQQEADGLGMRSDIVASLSRMTSFLQAADRAVAEHDAAAANKNLDRVEKELTTLEGFLGKS